MLYYNYQNKISPNNKTSFTGFLGPKLLNIPLASCFLINHYFSPPHIAHFHNIIVLPVLALETLGVMFPVFFFTL